MKDWVFLYKKGPQPLQGVVQAGSERRAYRVAQVWCERNRCKGPLTVKPFVCADESILSASELAEFDARELAALEAETTPEVPAGVLATAAQAIKDKVLGK